MVVSSNTLFQFTSSLDVVKSILLSEGFWPRYCIEYGWKKLFAVPQCCFCDIPLSAIQTHMKIYGEYGFGMEKEWGINHNVAPVSGIINASPLVKTLSGIFRAIRNNEDGKEEERKFLAFIKQYKAVYYRRTSDGVEKQIRSYPYYDEREWRYVPIELPSKMLVRVLEKKTDFDSDSESEITKKHLCRFEAKDVRYIIVKTDNDRVELIDFINSRKEWDNNFKSILCSRIITNQLITEDI